MTRIY
jgi:hypothetical protein